MCTLTVFEITRHVQKYMFGLSKAENFKSGNTTARASQTINHVTKPCLSNILSTLPVDTSHRSDVMHHHWRARPERVEQHKLRPARDREDLRSNGWV